MEFRDGRTKSLSANLIAENLFSQIDDKGNRHVLLDEIIDQQKGEGAINKVDPIVTLKNGVKQRRHTTQGWQLLCQ